MAPKTNPLRLNPLQLRTLTLLQELARWPRHARPGTAEGEIVVCDLPHPHGDHFHIGDAVASSRDATGLANPSVWIALERKGLIRSRFPDEAVITREGIAYDTGLRGSLLGRGDH